MESKEEVKTEVLAHLTRVFGQPSQVVKAKGGVEVWMWLDPEDTLRWTPFFGPERGLA